MISGPTIPHPRLLLADLLRSKGGLDRLGGVAHHFLESGLVFLEEDVEFGEGIRVDFLARDASGAPVLILAVDDEGAAEIPLALLDLDLWFRENAFLLRQGLGLLDSAPVGLRWDLEHRIFLVTRGLRASRLKRLEGLTSLPLQVFELLFFALRGKRQWYARSLPAWQQGPEGELPLVPEGLVDPHQAALVGLFLERLGSLSAALEVHGDRYHRLVLFEGRPCVELRCSDREAHVNIEGRPQEEVFTVVADVEAAIDQVLRLLLARQADQEGFAAVGQAQAQAHAPVDPVAGDLAEPPAHVASDRLPDGLTSGDDRLAEPLREEDARGGAPNSRVLPAKGRLRMGGTPPQKLPEARDLGPKLTEEEIDAFMHPRDLNPTEEGI